jgi:hypothetical protein
MTSAFTFACCSASSWQVMQRVQPGAASRRFCGCFRRSHRKGQAGTQRTADGFLMAQGGVPLFCSSSWARS